MLSSSNYFVGMHLVLSLSLGSSSRLGLLLGPANREAARLETSQAIQHRYVTTTADHAL